jgi:hypothetical protein
METQDALLWVGVGFGCLVVVLALAGVGYKFSRQFFQRRKSVKKAAPNDVFDAKFSNFEKDLVPLA